MNKAILLTAVLLANLTLMGAAPLMTQKDLKFTWIKNNPNYVVTFTPEIVDHFFIFQKNSLHLKLANFSSLKRMSIFTSRKILREKLKLYSASKRV